MKRLRLGGIVGLFLLFTTSTVYAAQSSSGNFQVNEVQFGAGASKGATSPNYKADQSLGSTAVGRTGSTNYGADAGFLTPNVPFLEMKVTAANIDLGTLSIITAATGTATFSVRAYVDSGYTVVTMNDVPISENNDTLPGPSSPTASAPGTNQFGINLVRNQTTCPTPAPANFGANPSPVPNSGFATGQAASGYNTCGLFKYVKGDTIVQTGAKGWGQTDYTISYIANISSTMRAGRFQMTQDLVVVATF